MKSLTRALLLSFALSLLFSVGSVQVFAGEIMKPDNYPKRPVTIIVCFGKGGGSDQAVAALQAPASAILGVKVNKINKPGGGGVNCLPDFQQAPGDGYTILQHADTLVSKYVSGEHDLHPTKNLTPIMISNVAPTGLFVKPGDDRFYDGGKPSFDKLVAYAKANTLMVSNINVAMELVTMSKIEEYFGFSSKQVMFDKPAQRYGAVIGGKLDVLMEQPGDVIKHVQGGKLAPVLSIWPERFKIFSDTKATGADYGMKWDPLLRIRGLWVKNETPSEIKKYLEAVFAKAYDSGEHQAFLKRKSLDIVNSYYNTADTAAVLDTAISTYAKIFKEAGEPVRDSLK
jgi:tripartite-type tricarboxylate transporter receptor subunit TctC